MGWLTWSRYWAGLSIFCLLAFLGPEIYALATNWRNTFSMWVWQFERFVPGQSVWHWNARHFLIAASLVWLFGHFVLGFWR